MEPSGIVDDGRETCHTTCHNLIRHQEHRESNGVEHQSNEDEEIVSYLI